MSKEPIKRQRINDSPSFGHEIYPNQATELIEFARNLDVNYENLEKLHAIQLAVTRSGDFANGSSLRNHLVSYIDELQKSKERPRTFRQYQIHSASKFELETFKDTKIKLTKNLKENINVYKLMRQESKFFGRLMGTNLEPRDAKSEIAKKIHGKKILLLGPSPSENGQGTALEKFDLVAKINIKSDNRNITTLPRDLPEIIYLNGQLTKSFKTKNYLKSLEANSIIVRRNPFTNKYLRGTPETFDINLLQFSTPLLMAPRVLVDLLSYQPAEIEIRGVNFYCTPMRYFDGFKKTSNQSVTEIFEHDLVSSFNFMRFVIKNSATPVLYDRDYFNFTMHTDSFFSLLNQTFSHQVPQ